MPVTRDMLLSELKELQRLTAFEQAVATVRRVQAASTPISQELAANATRAGERLTLLGSAVRGVGGTPDLVGPVLGKLTALLQTQLNQVQTLQGALLGDLALEHQLRERARYARTLAVTLGEGSVVPVLDRLDAAHTETIAWIEQRLTEVARTGSSALKATPVQEAVGAVRRVAGAPLAYAATGINGLGGLVNRITRRTPAAFASAAETVQETAASAASTVQEAAASAVETVQESAASAAEAVQDTTASVSETVQDTAASVAETVKDTTASAAETVQDTAASAAETVQDKAASTAETVQDTTASVSETVQDTAASAAETVQDAAPETKEEAAERAEEATHEVLEATGGDDVADAKAPFAGYERLSGDSIMRHVDDTEDLDELRVLLAFEQAHKARKGVLKSAQDRLTALADA